MNSVPPTFMHAVVRFVRDENLDEIDGLFGEISIASFKDNFNVYLEMVYQQPAADTVQYRILRDQNCDFYDCTPYTFAPGDYRFVNSLKVMISRENRTVNGIPWASAKLTDATFCNWLKAPFEHVALDIEEGEEFDCAKILELLPDYFNEIDVNCKYNEILDKIIHKSNEEMRLKFLNCPQFYDDRTLKEVLRFTMSNVRLYSPCEVDYAGSSFAATALFELWISEPEMFTQYCGFSVQKTDALTSISRFSFQRSLECYCFLLGQKCGFVRPQGADCLHFKYNHRVASGRQVLLTLFLGKRGFENVTSVSQAMNYDPVSFFIEFCC